MRGDASICGRSTVERVYPTIKITTDVTNAFCSQKGWQAIDGTGL